MFGRLPVVRRYNSSGFVPATWPITTSVAPEKRTSYSFKCDNRGGQLDAAALAPTRATRLRAVRRVHPRRLRGRPHVSFTRSTTTSSTTTRGRSPSMQGRPNPYNGNPKHLSHTEFKAIYAQLYQVLQEATLTPRTRSGWSPTSSTTARRAEHRADREGRPVPRPVGAGARHDRRADVRPVRQPRGQHLAGHRHRLRDSHPVPRVRAAEMLAVINRLGWGKAWRSSTQHPGPRLGPRRVGACRLGTSR